MKNHIKRSRMRRVLAIGALVGTVMSVGAIGDAGSASETDSDGDAEAASIYIKATSDWGSMSMRSGVRW